LGGLWLEASPGKVCKTLISKITREKWTGVVEHVLYRYEALSLNISYTKNK
jgi:hypothetical protein